MEKVVIALNRYDGYAKNFGETEKFLMYDIVDGEIVQLSLASLYDQNNEEKIKFLKQNHIKAMFIVAITDEEFIKIPPFGLRVITSFATETLYTELINNYINDNYDFDEYTSVKDYQIDKNIVPPLSNDYMHYETLPFELGEELVDLHLNSVGNGEGGFKES